MSVREIQNVVRGIAEGEMLSPPQRRGEREVVLLAQRQDITITHSRYAPGTRGPDPHVHHEHTDSFYVLEGELAFELGPEPERVRLGAGGFVAVPPNVVHSFVNESDADARFLNLHTPDKGFADYMRGHRDGRDASFDSFEQAADGGRPASEVVVVEAGAGERLVGANRIALLKAVLPHLSLAEWTVEGGFGGPPVHDHDDRVDSFYVLEGELDVTIEDSVLAAGADTLVSVPRGIRHAFAHRRDGKVRFLNIHAPDAGFADFLRGVSDRDSA